MQGGVGVHAKAIDGRVARVVTVLYLQHLPGYRPAAGRGPIIGVDRTLDLRHRGATPYAWLQVLLHEQALLSRRWRSGAIHALYQLEAPGFGDGLGAVPGLQLAVDVGGVGLDRAHGDEQVAPDLAVGPTRG